LKRGGHILLFSLIFLGVVLVLAGAGILGPVHRSLLSVALTLMLPGFAVTVLLFKGSSLRVSERLLLSFGLSLPLAGLAVLAMNWIPRQVQTLPTFGDQILAGLSILTILVLAVFLRGQLDSPALQLPPIGLYRAGLLFLAGLTCLLAYNLARSPTATEGLSGYTLLWVQPAAPDRLQIGVQNQEFTSTSYRLELESGGAQKTGPTLEMAPGETREFFLDLSDNRLEGETLTVRLYRMDQPDQVYRQVVWWLGAGASGKVSE
jgi:uncharacterized membrane protein